MCAFGHVSTTTASALLVLSTPHGPGSYPLSKSGRLTAAPSLAAFDLVLSAPDPVVDTVLDSPVQTLGTHRAGDADAFGLFDLCPRRALLSHWEKKLGVLVQAQRLVTPGGSGTAHAGTPAGAALPRSMERDGAARVSEAVMRA
jgi:hypothetical protein